MKNIRLCAAAIAAAFLAQEALAQNTATSTSSSSANPTSNASSTGNVQSNTHSSTNNTNSTSSANQNATATSSNSQNNGSASSVNANITLVTPAPAAGSAAADGRLRQSVESSSHTTGEHRQYIDYSGSYTVKNVPNVSAPPLISSNDTCMGSASGGVSVAGFGITGGSTYTDEHCKRIKMSRELWNKGMKAASLALDCMDPEAREALELTGFTCPQTARAQRVAAEQAMRQVTATLPAVLRPGAYQPPIPAEALASQPAQSPVTAMQSPAPAVEAAAPPPSAQVQVKAIPDTRPPLHPSAVLAVALEPAGEASAAPGDQGSVLVRRVDRGATAAPSQ